ncbi:PREDICTED: G-type lectin S-receptor-like serine/threonine-protein kinase B120 isoform X1 [Ipomoea nil]|uniref:G-type lectin S-receptor-like serine/threonine-protein kinase B120 isoform X1 n=1 Tax=Ipomoea nil TaxID=35883 RepID=UPI0009008EDA|nr:PREDICTED: G-type lectin S-receptor-like serine/threonine-protein kinase B120 isoform X1 [Ipomoea nil]
MAERISFLGLFLGVLCFLSVCFAADKIQQGQWIKDDGENIVSANEKFVLGFFSPEGTSNRYVGIWYNEIIPQSVVWVANRERPILDKNGAFGITGNGTFVVLDGKNVSIWNTNSSVTSSNATMVLRNTSELIILKTDGWRPNNTIWQSFHQPTDTFLPGMRVDLSAGESKLFTSWTNSGNPSPGRFSMGIDPRASPQIVIWEGEKRYWRSGHWDGRVFLGVPMRTDFVYGFDLITENDNLYLEYKSSSSDLIMFKVDWNGKEVQQRWNESRKQWIKIQEQPADQCGVYNHCGQFARCDNSSSNGINCVCIVGFNPSDWNQWNARNWTGGCTRRTPLQCQKNNTEGGGAEKDGFREVKHIKLPDFADIDRNMRSPEDCKKKCEEDCSCNAYAPPVPGGISCMLWRNELVDMMQLDEGSGSTLFVRLHSSELDNKSSKTTIIVAVSVVAAVAVLVIVSIWLLCSRRARIRAAKKRDEIPRTELPTSGEFSSDFSAQCDLTVEGKAGASSDLVFFSFSSIAAATDSFSLANKLGQGGFGHVYKGVLPCGQEIAVKRLSRRSGQGVQEFTNELTVIAKLQHRNLVRLLGCCIEGDEKMLLYEYMPNKSLDSFVFDPAKRSELNWRKRFHIIEEIARGLLYLHRDSRLRIIHRDLKASNILLDGEMNPKISDFGMARIFGGNQNEANTNRVVGTYGYMAPEYAMEGLFSVKSDVYSFGVLLLEIVSGRRNTSFRTDDHSGIIEYAWEQWDEGKPMNLLDPSIFSSCVPQEVLRCIQLGLLCVQDLAVHRPNMSAVVLFLETDNVTLPVPRPPTYTASMRRSVDVDSWNQNNELPSSNSITMSVIVGR